jgi:ribosomal protein S18 acetylase RimI-like enzyme
MIRIERAGVVDARELTRISWKSFEHDINYGAPGIGGPPGYKSVRWQTMLIQRAKYFKVLFNDKIIGGFVVFPKENGHYELGRIFIDPDYQNQGIGTKVLEHVEELFPEAKRWRLGTPSWNRRNRHFYEKIGYTKVGEDEIMGCLYEKKIGFKQ